MWKFLQQLKKPKSFQRASSKEKLTRKASAWSRTTLNVTNVSAVRLSTTNNQFRRIKIVWRSTVTSNCSTSTMSRMDAFRFTTKIRVVHTTGVAHRAATQSYQPIKKPNPIRLDRSVSSASSRSKSVTHCRGAKVTARSARATRHHSPIASSRAVEK